MHDILAKLDDIHGAVSVIGSMNADYTVSTERLPGPGETVNGGPLQVLPGGKSGNQAAAAARIGANVRIFGAVGSDANADFLLGKLTEAGVDTQYVRHVLGPSGTTVIAVARMGREAGATVLLNNSPFTTELPRELIEASDILLVNEHEMAQLLGINEPEDDDWDGMDWHAIADKMHDYGFRQAVITLGGDGSVVIDGDDIHRISPVRVQARDTTGCGDSFMGTILAGLSSGMTLMDSAQLASYVSAYAATNYGAQASYGTAAQIRAAFA